MCTPTLSEIRRLFPQTKVVMLTRPPLRSLFAPHGWVDSFIVDEGSPISRRPSRWRAVQKVYQQIRSERFDLSLILLGGDWAPYLCLAKIPLRVDEASNYFARFAHVVYPMNVQHRTPGGFLGALRALHLPVKESLPTLRPSESSSAKVQDKLKARGITDQDILIVVHPFASTKNRHLSPQKIQDLIEGLVREGFYVGVIGGSEGLSYWGAVQRRGSAWDGRVVDWVGKLDLEETCALMARANVVVTTDSGPLHIAGALRRPTVGLFRAIRPEYATLYPTVVPLFWEEGTACLPGCSWESWYGCQAQPCRQLEGISTEAMLTAVQKLLQS